MKNTMFKTTVLTVALIVATTAMAFAQTVPAGLLYENEGNGVKITGYNGTATTLVIPSSIGGRSVTIIGDAAFREKYTLESVTLPNTITIIGAQAFYQCYDLRSINWPTSLTTIGDNAFFQCQSLVGSVTFPAPLRTIGSGAFYETGLTGVTFNNGLLTIGSVAFQGVRGLRSVTIPASVTSIGNYAFYQISNLAVTMSRSTQVGEDTFATRAVITYR